MPNPNPIPNPNFDPDLTRPDPNPTRPDPTWPRPTTGNRFDGAIPVNLPASIMAVQVLDLSANFLVDPLPHAMYRLRELTFLRLDNNPGLDTSEYAEGLQEALTKCVDMRL